MKPSAKDSSSGSRIGGKASLPLLVIGSAAIVTVLSAIVIIATVVGPFASKTAIKIPTATPVPTFTPSPTATLPALATPQIGSTAPSYPGFEAYVIDPLTGRVLLAQNATHPQAMASTTKMMTALVALIFGNPDQVITVTSDALNIEAGSSTMGVEPGEQFTLRELLYGLLLPSGDDAAIAIADGLLGSQTAYIARMNQIAAWLGLTSTLYVDTNGLSASDHTSAVDLARLAEVALEIPLFRQIVATPTLTLPASAMHPEFKLLNTNILLTAAPSMGIVGVKTGFTSDAGHCVVLDARLAGQEVIVVVLGDGLDNARFLDGLALVAWAFNELGLHVVAPIVTATPPL